MARKKAEVAEEGAYWMDTYGDMVTLLLTFFVLLFAMSSLNADKWELFVKAFTGQTETPAQIVINVNSPGEEVGDEKVPPSGDGETVGNTDPIETPTNFEELFLYLKQYVEEQGLQNEVQISKGEGYTYIQFSNNIFFDGDQSVLRPDSYVILDFMSQAFAYIPEQIKEIAIYGHTAQEASDKENNIDFDFRLSSARATNVGLYLMNKQVLDPGKFSCTGYGQYHPVAPHDGQEVNRAKNRRVEFKISEEGKKTVPIEEVYEQVAKGEEPDLAGNDNPDDATASDVTSSDSTSSDVSDSEEKKGESNEIVLNVPKFEAAATAQKILDSKT